MTTATATKVRHQLCTMRGVIVTWSPRNKTEVEQARQLFDRYRQRAPMFAVDASGGATSIRDGEMITAFDPNTDILMQEQYSGG